MITNDAGKCRVVPVTVITHFFVLLQLEGFSGSFVVHSTYGENVGSQRLRVREGSH